MIDVFSSASGGSSTHALTYRPLHRRRREDIHHQCRKIQCIHKDDESHQFHRSLEVVTIRIASIVQNSRIRLGVAQNDMLVLIDDINKTLPKEKRFPTSAIVFIEHYPKFSDFLNEQLRRSINSGSVTPLPVADVTFAPPVPDARKLLCVAGNYAEHIEEGGGKAPDRDDILPPRVFMKPPSTTMIGSGAPVVLTDDNVAVDWELELGVVIGRRVRSVTPAEARACIFGYTVVNDISERRFNPGERSKERSGDWFFDWINGKWFDGFAPVGPYVVTKDEIPDPHNLSLTLDVSGKVYQKGSTSDMLDDVDILVSFFSRIMTLEPGDIIATGTPAGVGDAKGRYLKPGDVMTGTIDHIGTLTNPVVYESNGGRKEQ